MAGQYVFGGAWKQGEILESEGVHIEDNKVDLKQYQWDYFGDKYKE